MFNSTIKLVTFMQHSAKKDKNNIINSEKANNCSIFSSNCNYNLN